MDNIETTIRIPKGATNGDVIMMLFPNNPPQTDCLLDLAMFHKDWWNTTYEMKENRE